MDKRDTRQSYINKGNKNNCEDQEEEEDLKEDLEEDLEEEEEHVRPEDVKQLIL